MMSLSTTLLPCLSWGRTVWIGSPPGIHGLPVGLAGGTGSQVIVGRDLHESKEAAAKRDRHLFSMDTGSAGLPRRRPGRSRNLQWQFGPQRVRGRLFQNGTPSHLKSAVEREATS